MNIQDDYIHDESDLRWSLSYAVGFHNLGMHSEALDELDTLPECWQERAEVLCLRGQIFLSQERWEEVVEHSTAAAERYPSSPDFYIQAALAYDKLDRPEDARCIWLAAPRELRSTAFYHYNLARCETKLGHFALARQHTRTAMTLSGEIAKVVKRDPALLFFASDPETN